MLFRAIIKADEKICNSMCNFNACCGIVQYCGSNIIANASYLGSYGNAVNTIVFPMTIIEIAIAVMAGDGACTYVSISLGAKHHTRVIDLMKLLMGTETLIGLIAFVIFLIFPYQLVLLFCSRHESSYYTEFAVWLIRARLVLNQRRRDEKGTPCCTVAQDQAHAL